MINHLTSELLTISHCNQQMNSILFPPHKTDMIHLRAAFLQDRRGRKYQPSKHFTLLVYGWPPVNEDKLWGEAEQANKIVSLIEEEQHARLTK
jgi:hypothetical protein